MTIAKGFSTGISGPDNIVTVTIQSI